MATVIRAELSETNKYWISKHRYYELKHFCLQYSSWIKTYNALNELAATTTLWDKMPSSNVPADLTATYAIRRAHYSDRIKMLEETAMKADKDLYVYILKAVTEGLSYTYLRTKLEIPCSRDMYYDRYRRFFWLLDQAKN